MENGNYNKTAGCDAGETKKTNQNWPTIILWCYWPTGNWPTGYWIEI